MNAIGGAQERAKLRDKELVKCTCIDCGVEYELTRGRFRRIKDGNYRCKPCMKKWHDAEVTKTWANKTAEEMNTINNKKTEAWNNKSDEERAKQVAGMHQQYRNLSEEEKRIRNDKLQQGSQNYYKNRSIEEANRLKQIQSYNMKSYWESMDNDDKSDRLDALHNGWNRWWNSLSKEEQDFEMSLVHQGREEWWKSMSENDKVDFMKNLSLKHSEWYDQLTPEELLIISKRSSDNSKNYWSNLSIEERNLIKKKQIDSWLIKSNFDKEKDLDAAWNTIISNYNPTDTELEFINLLKVEKFNFLCQFRSEIIYDNFYELFPRHPISGGFVSGKHTWDFKIDLLNRSVLVDIDGRIHKDSELKNDDFNKHVAFYDSQRIYKTDGLDAYVIKCYTDKLNMNDKVINIKTKEEMSLQTFIALLNSYNLTQTEMKELMKNL